MQTLIVNVKPKIAMTTYLRIKLNLNFCEEEGTRIIIKKKLLKIPELKSYLTF